MREANANTRAIFWTTLIGVYAIAALYAANWNEPRLDEFTHLDQIHRFLAGNFSEPSYSLTTIPGYHLIVATIMRIFGATSLGVARMINASFGFLAVVGFHAIRKQAIGRDDYIATAQFAVLPIFFLFVFMAQTDAMSLAFVLLAVWASRKDRHWIAAGFLLASMAARQINVFWIALLIVPIVQELRVQRGAASFRRTIVATIPYAILVIAFLVFWRINGSISLSHFAATYHPDVSIHSGNLFCMLFIAGVLLIPQCAFGWIRFARAVSARPLLILVPLGLVVLYAATFAVDNPLNLMTPPDVRNWILQRTVDSTAWHIGFGAIAIFGGIGLLWTRLIPRDGWLIWPLSFLFVSLFWLIEERYYLIPFALVLAWREHLSPKIEIATTALWSVLAVLFFWGMMSGQLYI